MRIIDKFRGLVGQWQDPYEYECTVCERTFQEKRARCSNCGGRVERIAPRDSQLTADPHH